jgi:hypothetical protein
MFRLSKGGVSGYFSMKTFFSTQGVIVIASVFNSFFVNPSYNLYKICYKRRNGAFYDGRVSSHDIFFNYLGVVELIDHYMKENIIKDGVSCENLNYMENLRRIDVKKSKYLSLPPEKSFPGKISSLSSFIQATTCTKSATKLGIKHLMIAEFPRITYSFVISAS